MMSNNAILHLYYNLPGDPSGEEHTIAFARAIEAKEREGVDVDAQRWRLMQQPFIGGYISADPNPGYLCKHRHRIEDCITCVNAWLEYEHKRTTESKK